MRPLSWLCAETSRARTVSRICCAGGARPHAHPAVAHDPNEVAVHRIGRDEGAEVAAAAIRVLDATAIRWISCDDDVLEEVSWIKAGSRISVADAWIAATAALRGEALVHKDPEFLRVEHVMQKTLDH